jgi:hypothetical protein
MASTLMDLQFDLYQKYEILAYLQRIFRGKGFYFAVVKIPLGELYEYYQSQQTIQNR